MTDEQIIEHCLASVSEYDPPCKVPEGIWGFTDRTLRLLLRLAIESKGDQMFDPHAAAQAQAQSEFERVRLQLAECREACMGFAVQRDEAMAEAARLKKALVQRAQTCGRCQLGQMVDDPDSWQCSRCHKVWQKAMEAK